MRSLPIFFLVVLALGVVSTGFTVSAELVGIPQDWCDRQRQPVPVLKDCLASNVANVAKNTLKFMSSPLELAVLAKCQAGGHVFRVYCRFEQEEEANAFRDALILAWDNHGVPVIGNVEWRRESMTCDYVRVLVTVYPLAV